MCNFVFYRIPTMDEGNAFRVNVKISSMIRAGPVEDAGHPDGVAMLVIPPRDLDFTCQIALSQNADRVDAVRYVEPHVVSPIKKIADHFARKDDLPAIVFLSAFDQVIAADAAARCKGRACAQKGQGQSRNYDAVHLFFTFFETYTTSAKMDMNSSRASHMMTI